MNKYVNDQVAVGFFTEASRDLALALRWAGRPQRPKLSMVLCIRWREQDVASPSRGKNGGVSDVEWLGRRSGARLQRPRCSARSCSRCWNKHAHVHVYSNIEHGRETCVRECGF
jgi:hypothetical protein